MCLGLIGSTGHWQTYAPALRHVPGLTVVAVAAAGPEETTGAFDHAPGLTADTRRYDDARKMLDAEKLDVVQVAGRNDRIPAWSRLPGTRAPGHGGEAPGDGPAHTRRAVPGRAEDRAASFPCTRCAGSPSWRRCREAVRGGEIGEPLMSFSQKTYKWGKSRPDAYRSRKTFPGLAPWVGIHAFDWLHWILGDVFADVRVGRG